MKSKEIIKNIIDTPPKKRIIKRKLKPQKAAITSQNNRVFIDHPFDLKLRKKYHFMGTITWDSLMKKWELKNLNDKDTCQFLLEINKEAPQYSWEISSEAYTLLNNAILDRKKYIEQAKDKLKIKKKINNDIDFSFMKVEPFPFQKVGVEFIEVNNGIAYIGDSMGLGKTMQAIAYTSKNKLMTVIVCPASLKYNWKREIEKFTHNNSLVLSEYSIPEREKEITTRKYNDLIRKELDSWDYSYIIINYEQVDKYKDILSKIPFDCVVLDEAQYISNNRTKRTKSVFTLFSKIPKRILLSGTGIKSRPIEFYPQLKFLRSDLFPNKEKYGLRYCNAVENTWGKGYDYTGSSNLRELNFKISPFYIRRIKENVLKELPEKTINILDLEMSPTELKEYKTLLSDFNKEYRQHATDKQFSFLAKVVKLKQHLSKMKIKKIIELTDDLLLDDPTRKVIIFSQFRETQSMLFEHYKDIAVSVFAKHKSEKRIENIDELTNDSSKKVLIASTIAGGIGLNITAADTVVFCDLLWNPADHEQAEDRSYRLGQKKKVNIYYLNYLDSVESMLWKILKGKEVILGQVLDGKKEQETPDEKEVFKLFMKEFLKEFNTKN